MRITVEERPDADEVEVRVTCRAVDGRVQAIVAAVGALDRRLTGIADGALVIVDAAQVLYAESVDGACFLYGADGVIECPLRLAELEERLRPGMRVLVPFAAGNRGSDGIVLSVGQAPSAGTAL